MDQHDHVCVCFKVSLHKLTTFMEREQPSVPSELSQCLQAGTGCGWCVPFLCRLHAQHAAGQQPDLAISPEEYVARRSAYKTAGKIHQGDEAADAGAWQRG